VLSRITAREGLPFSIFCTTTDIREGLRARSFFDITKSANTVRSLVTGNRDRVRQAMISKMTQHLQKGQKFKLTVDALTALGRRDANLLTAEALIVDALCHRDANLRRPR